MLFAIAGVFLSVAVPLLFRDRKNLAAIERRIAAGESREVADAESARMAVVIAKYPLYRWAYAAMVIATAIVSLVTRSGFANGIAVGLLLFAATGLVVDQYSEQRAVAYQAQLH